MSGIKFLITLVHGTWASNAKWTRDGSVLRSTLSEELKTSGAESVEFSTFQWSGKNRYADRRIAAVRLRKQLLRQVLAHPEYRHVIISHSHGGNVALRALSQSPTLRKHLLGLVTIATPYLKFRKQDPTLALVPRIVMQSLRDLEPSPFLLFWFALAILFLPVEALITWLIDSPAIERNVETYFLNVCSNALGVTNCQAAYWGSVLVSVVLVVCMNVVGVLYSARKTVLTEVGPRLNSERRRILKRHAYSQPEAILQPVANLAMTSVIDEAYAALTGGAWIHRASFWIARIVQISTILAGAAALAAAVYYATTSMTELETFYRLPYKRVGFPILLFVAAVASAIVVGICTMAVAMICAVVNPFLRLDDPRQGWLVRVEAFRNPGPIPNLTEIAYSIRQLLRGGRLALFHSQIYASPSAIADMSTWLTGIVAARAETGR